MWERKPAAYGDAETIKLPTNLFLNKEETKGQTFHQTPPQNTQVYLLQANSLSLQIRRSKYHMLLTMIRRVST